MKAGGYTIAVFGVFYSIRCGTVFGLGGPPSPTECVCIGINYLIWSAAVICWCLTGLKGKK